MIDSPNVEERIEGMQGIKCMDCLDTGFVKTFRNGAWFTVCERDPLKDSDGKETVRLKRCTCGKDYGF